MFEEYLKFSCFAYRNTIFDKSFVYDQGDVPTGAENVKKTNEAPGVGAEKPPVDQEAVEKADAKAREKGNTMIEAGVRIQAPSVDKSSDHIKDTDTFGGEVVGRYVLTDPTKPYIALTVPVTFKYESTVEASYGAQVSSILSDAYTISAGLGVEGGVPIADVVTIYGGVGAEAGLRVYDYAMIDENLQAEEGTLFAPDIAAFGIAGVRVNPIASWHLYAGVKPTVTFTGGPGMKENEPVFNVPVHVGTGFSF